MSVAILYSSIQPAPGREKEIYGLNVAIGDWLRAWLRFSRTEKFTFLIGHQQELDEVREKASQAGIDPARLTILDSRYPEKNMAGITTVFRPEPGTRNLLWQRQVTQGFAFCGLAHAISGVEAGQVLEEYCLGPSEATDAIICPSQAVQSAVRNFWDAYGDYLKTRFGASYACPVQTPVIPLGIDIEKFERRTTPDKRAAQRAALGIGENDSVILWVGRLSAAIKAHPLAMFRAAERAAQITATTNQAGRVHLVMVGYFVPIEAEAQFKNLANDMCAKANVIFIAADDARFPDGLWAAGDIFLSLVDNIQESFGLTPIEAMAAGLPRVLSDWDGYRDSVTDGEDGFLIRTTQPPPGNGFDFTARIASNRDLYGTLLAKLALTVAVDAEQAGDRLARLIADPSLRAAIAAKARARVKAVYGWQQIIPAYEELWRELGARRAASLPPRQKWASALPQLPDPYAMYENYPSSRMAESDCLKVVLPYEQIRALLQHDLNMFAHDVLIGSDEIVAVLKWLAQSEKGADIAAVFAHFSGFDRPSLWRTLAWLQKLGIIENRTGGTGLKA